MWGSAINEANRYPLARTRTARNRDRLNPTSKSPAVTRLFRAKVEFINRDKGLNARQSDTGEWNESTEGPE